MLFLIETAPSPLFILTKCFWLKEFNIPLEMLFSQAMLQGKVKKMHSEGCKNILQ